MEKTEVTEPSIEKKKRRCERCGGDCSPEICEFDRQQDDNFDDYDDGTEPQICSVCRQEQCVCHFLKAFKEHAADDKDPKEKYDEVLNQRSAPRKFIERVSSDDDSRISYDSISSEEKHPRSTTINNYYGLINCSIL